MDIKIIVEITIICSLFYFMSPLTSVSNYSSFCHSKLKLKPQFHSSSVLYFWWSLSALLKFPLLCLSKQVQLWVQHYELLVLSLIRYHGCRTYITKPFRLTYQLLHCFQSLQLTFPLYILE